MAHPRKAKPRLWIGWTALLSLALLLGACVRGGSGAQLQAPSNVTAGESSGFITITWDAPENGETGFDIQRAQQPAPAAIGTSQDLTYETIATLEPTARQYVDTDVTPGNTYYYAVIATYPTGNSDPSTPEGDSGITIENPPVENQPPTAFDVAETTDEDTPVELILAAEDPEGQPLTFEILTAPAHGDLTGSGSDRTYTPDPNYSGEDSFTFRVTDGANTSNTATVTITINPVADAPTILKPDQTPYADGEIATLALDAGATTDELELDATDPDPIQFLPEFFWRIHTQPTTGTASISKNGTITFTADTGPTRDDAFTVRVYDEDPGLFVTALYDELHIEVAITGPTGVTVGAFNPCGATGRTGPSQTDCDAAYLTTDLEGNVTVTNGIQSITIAETGTYRIVAEGAQGASGSVSYVGGRGVQMQADFPLTAGDTLYIVVGQQGIASQGNGAGGGGSFVVTTGNTPLLIAGGGGGIRTNASQNGCDANTGEYGIIGSSSSPTSSCNVKTTDLGEGGIVSGSSWGSAGAGFNSDGQNDETRGEGGYSWANGMYGGQANSTESDGGFGGGGSGAGGLGGGGGGGYSGGDGGWIAGGAGSYIAPSGTNPVPTAAGSGVGEGDGFVTITLLVAP